MKTRRATGRAGGARRTTSRRDGCAGHACLGSANLTGRQGYPLRYADLINRVTIADNRGLGIDVPIQSDPNAFRYPDVHVVDLLLEKEFTFSDFGLTLGVDVFNALNESYVLQRQGVLAQNGVPLDSSGSVLETLSPRIFRLGARLSFR